MVTNDVNDHLMFCVLNVILNQRQPNCVTKVLGFKYAVNSKGQRGKARISHSFSPTALHYNIIAGSLFDFIIMKVKVFFTLQLIASSYTVHAAYCSPAKPSLTPPSTDESM